MVPRSQKTEKMEDYYKQVRLPPAIWSISPAPFSEKDPIVHLMTLVPKIFSLGPSFEYYFCIKPSK